MDVTAIDDINLLDEVDEMIRSQLAELKTASSAAEFKRLVHHYGRFYDIIDAGLLSGPPLNETYAFREQIYEFLAEGFWAKIEMIYDPELNLSEQQTREIITTTRAKLKRLECALFGG